MSPQLIFLPAVPSIAPHLVRRNAVFAVFREPGIVCHALPADVPALASLPPAGFT